ncbi:hypothetical protein ONZ45_g18032 [Pleurotus djamor]|nr:hypothetical protein ONZ45_g18032 [Pleurotus djamor]
MMLAAENYFTMYGTWTHIGKVSLRRRHASSSEAEATPLDTVTRIRGGGSRCMTHDAPRTTFPPFRQPLDDLGKLSSRPRILVVPFLIEDICHQPYIIHPSIAHTSK